MENYEYGWYELKETERNNGEWTLTLAKSSWPGWIPRKPEVQPVDDRRFYIWIPSQSAIPHPAPASNDKLIKADYEEVLADHRRLVRELDVIINGRNAAHQASLCDIVSQLRKEWPDLTRNRGMRWRKDQYEKLYLQIKSGIRSVCYVDNDWGGGNVCRDICTIKPTSPRMELSSRGIGYGSINDPGFNGTELERFVQMCQHCNVEWLDETAGEERGEPEAVRFAVWKDENALPVNGGKGWIVFLNEQDDTENLKANSIAELYQIWLTHSKNNGTH